jgi:hypothetical protein
MMEFLQALDLSKYINFLAGIGAVALGLPALLQAMVVFFKIIPGQQPDKILEKMLTISEKVSEVVGKVFPKHKK